MSLIGPLAEAAVAVLAVVGIIATVARWLRDQGGDAARLEARLAAIEKKLTPNGLDTEQVGDVVKRTENAVIDLGSKMDQHIGAESEARDQIWRELRRLARLRDSE